MLSEEWFMFGSILRGHLTGGEEVLQGILFSWMGCIQWGYSTTMGIILCTMAIPKKWAIVMCLVGHPADPHFLLNNLIYPTHFPKCWVLGPPLHAVVSSASPYNTIVYCSDIGIDRCNHTTQKWTRQLTKRSGTADCSACVTVQTSDG